MTALDPSLTLEQADAGLIADTSDGEVPPDPSCQPL